MIYRNKLLLAKIESVYDTDSVPTATNTIKTQGVEITPYTGETVQLDYDHRFLGSFNQVNTNPYAMFSCNCMFAGANTAGLEPGYQVLLRAAGLAGTQTATTTGTAATGAASTITLAGTATSADDAYNGMLIETIAGTGSGQEVEITDYNGTTKVATVATAWATAPDNTTTYKVYSDIVYSPLSTGFESISARFVRGTLQHRLTGVRGNVGISLARGQYPLWTFDNMTGSYVTPLATTATTPDWTKFIDPIPVTYTNTPTFTVDGYAACIESLTMSHNNNVIRRNGPNCRQTLITDRAVSGTVVLKAPDIGTKDYFSKVESHSTISSVAIAITHGTAIGNIITVSIPTAQLLNITETDVDGDVAYSMDFVAVPTSAGNNEVTYTIA